MAQMKSVEMVITPAQARVWIGTNKTYQRGQKREKVKQFARDMTNGKWVLNGEPIIFSNEKPPELLDGQHRLLACIEANVSFVSMVTEGVDPTLFSTIDMGINRTSTDIITITQTKIGKKIHNIHNVAAASVICLDYLERGFRRRNPLPREVSDFVFKNPLIEDWVSLAIKGSSKPERRYVNFMAALGFLVGFKYPDQAKEFIHKFNTGEMLDRGNPIMALRRYLLVADSVKHERASLNRKDIFSVMAKAWNDFMEEERVIKLRAPKEVPILIGESKVNYILK